MPRNITAAVAAAVAARAVRQVMFVELDFPSQFQRLHSWTGQYTVEGNVFDGVGIYGEISQQRESSDLSANGIVLSLAGVPTAEISLILNEQYTGRRAKVWRGYLDDQYQLIADPVGPRLYKMDAPRIVYGETVVIALACESSAAEWGRANVARYTDQDHQRRWPDDRFFQFVPDLVDAEIIWLHQAGAEDGGQFSSGFGDSGGGTSDVLNWEDIDWTSSGGTVESGEAGEGGDDGGDGGAGGGSGAEA